MPRKQGRKGEEEKEGHRVPAAPSLPSRSQTAANLPETTTKGSVTWLCRKAVLAAADTRNGEAVKTAGRIDHVRVRPGWAALFTSGTRHARSL
jgi:hypothetical protein